ncbi:MAG: hypothetical protein AABW52_03115 [Nanoarchaeota archaeon]
MDIFAHALWTYALFRIFNKKKYAISGAIFGVLPDLVAFIPFFFYMLINNIHFQRDASIFPHYTLIAYNITHSFIIFLVSFIVVYLILRKIALPMLGWGLHILIDIPSHTADFFPTPFLWPISNLTISGISWADKYFMIFNYSLIILVYSYISLIKERNFKSKK